jgi:hypothetical protein
LGGRRILEESVQFHRVQGAFQQGTEHDGDGGLLKETLEDLTKLHDCRLGMKKLSCETAASYH